MNDLCGIDIRRSTHTQPKTMTIAEFKALPRKNKKHEENLQLRICNYIKVKYPNVIFVCDTAAGMKLPIWVAKKAKQMRSNRGLPDLIILHPNASFHGLCLEIKREGTKLYLKDGETLVADEHLREQSEVINRLKARDYMACFCVGFDEAVKIIDIYLN